MNVFLLIVSNKYNSLHFYPERLDGWFTCCRNLAGNKELDSWGHDRIREVVSSFYRPNGYSGAILTFNTSVIVMRV